MKEEIRPWPALWAMILGFFMIMIDTTIVSIANPAIMRGLHLGNDYSAVMWVTSGYLLAVAVPLLVTGRLGDRYGPKNLYLIGMVIFTLSSAACGLSGFIGNGGIGLLVAARVVQGLGAAAMTPQTMSMITRIFPPDSRGAAMGIWGSVAGVATLVGPILGGILVDSLGWEWIFFINVPVGVVGFFLALKLVPRLETHSHSFDVPGILLSGVGLFLLVFGIQEGERYNWGAIFGPITVWMLIAAGVIVMGCFVFWESVNKKEPLIPLRLFIERNFSLSNAAISAVGFAITSVSFPLVYFFQTVRGLTPTQAALMMTPMAVLGGILSPIVGSRLTASNSRAISRASMLIFAAGMGVYIWMLSPTLAIGWFLLPSAIIGVANAGMWSPLGTTATRNLEPRDAGAGSGIYNTSRQIGSVLGSACIAAVIQWRVTSELPQTSGAGGQAGGVLPDFLKDGFTNAMAQSLFVPLLGGVVCAVIVSFLAKPKTTIKEDVAKAVGDSPVPRSPQ